MTTAISFPYSNAVTENDGKLVEIDVKSPFRGADGEIKLMGVIHNTGDIPLEVKLGVDITTTTTTTSNATETTVMEELLPYSRVLYPFSVSPFKFSIKSTDQKSQTTLIGIGKPFIINLEKLIYSKLRRPSNFELHQYSVWTKHRSCRNRQKLRSIRTTGCCCVCICP